MDGGGGGRYCILFVCAISGSAGCDYQWRVGAYRVVWLYGRLSKFCSSIGDDLYEPYSLASRNTELPVFGTTRDSAIRHIYVRI